jgi:hypothetical protein
LKGGERCKNNQPERCKEINRSAAKKAAGALQKTAAN